MRKIIVVLILALSMVFCLVACNQSANPEGTSETGDTTNPANSPGAANAGEPIVLNVATYMFPNTLDTLTEDFIATFNIVYYHVYDRLVEFDIGTNEWLPAIAKSWVNVNDTTWNFEINLDYRFSNGDQLTMDDVVYSLMRIKDVPKQAGTAALIENVTYEGNTLTLIVADAAVYTPARILSTAVIVSKSYIESVGDDALNNKPIGTGPYAVTEFTPGASATLELWDGYPFEKPQIDKINYTYILETAPRYIALETGLVDIVDQMTPYEMNMAKEDGFSTSTTELRQFTTFWFNCSKPPFDNVNVRRAFAYAFNREGFCALEGGRIPETGMLFIGYDDLDRSSGNLPEFDLDKAKALLEAEGYNESNPLHVDVNFMTGDPGIEMYQFDLLNIGVDLTITQREFSSWLAGMLAGEFDMIYVPYPNKYFHALTDINRVDVNEIPANNETRFFNERAQELVETIRVETDQQKLKQMAAELQDIVGQEVPYIPIYRLEMNYCMDSGLSGVMIDRLGITSFHRATFSR